MSIPENRISVEHDVEDLAGRLYTVYCRAVGGKAFNGDPLPPWSEFSVDLKKLEQSNAWRAVAREAIAAETGVASAPCDPIKVNDRLTCGEFTVDSARGYIRLNCSCGAAIVRQPWMSGNDWPEQTAQFKHQHRGLISSPGEPIAKGKPFKRPTGLFWLHTDNGDGERWHLCQIKMSPQGNVMKPMLQYLTEDFEDYWYDEDWCPEEIVEIEPPKN